MAAMAVMTAMVSIKYRQTLRKYGVGNNIKRIGTHNKDPPPIQQITISAARALPTRPPPASIPVPRARWKSKSLAFGMISFHATTNQILLTR